MPAVKSWATLRRLVVFFDALHNIMQIRRQSIIFYLGVASGLGLYLWLATAHLTQLGLQHDEVLQALPAVGLTTNADRGKFPISWQVRLGGGYRFPMMSMEYMGALKSWALTMAFALFGTTPVTLRSFGIFVGALGLGWLAWAARRAWGEWVAIGSLWLVASDASFVLFTCMDFGPVALAFCLRTMAGYAFVRWWQSGIRQWFWLSCGLCGLGLFDKVNFLGFLVGLATLTALRAWQRRPWLAWRDAAVGLGCVIFCSLPLWVFNLAKGFVTFRMISLPGQPASLSGLWQLAPARAEALRQMLVGRPDPLLWFNQPLPPLPFGLTNGWLLNLSGVAVIGLIALALLRRRWDWLLLPLLTALILLQIFLVPRPVWIHHWIGIYPLPQLMACLFVVALGQTLRRSALVESLGSLVLAGAIWVNLALVSGHHLLMVQTGGAGNWSNAIYGLSDHLQQNYPNHDLKVLDWGINNPLFFLSRGKLRTDELFWLEGEPKALQTSLVASLNKPQTIFLAHTEAKSNFPVARRTLEIVAAQAGLRLKITKVFYEQQGAPLLEILTVE
jgi:hypothetical protein